MSDPSILLATLTQASAVTVAIIGGFLVSRLVALSSEREGLRRQLVAAQDRLRQLKDDFESVHAERLGTSQDKFYDLALDKLIEDPNQDLAELIADNVPLGSSEEEIRPYAEELQRRVKTAMSNTAAKLHKNDTDDVTLEELETRGLQFAERDEEIYANVVHNMRARMAPAGGWLRATQSIGLPRITPGWRHEIDARRFDETRRQESELLGELKATSSDVDRVSRELDLIARPVGVVSAIWVLALLSLLGIVFPVLVMAFEPTHLGWGVKTALIASFMVGLAAVLGYVLWYLRLLRTTKL